MPVTTELLIDPDGLEALLHTETLVLEAGHQEAADYRSGHIPGALFADTNLFESLPLWNRLPDRALEERLVDLGIHIDKPVSVYDRGSFAAARTAAVLLDAGVRDVRVLDGGISAWLRAGYATEPGERLPVAADSFGAASPRRTRVFVGMDEVRATLADPRGVIVCMRTWEEFTGETSGYDYIEKAGRIPGSVWGRAGHSSGMEALHRPDGRARLLEEIADLWSAAGVTPDRRVVFYCGTGWRASAAYLYAAAMGWEEIAVFDGGWLEWSRAAREPAV